MFANFTGETATSSGDVLTCTGALPDHITFSKSFAEGALVAYVAKDATKKVSGWGVYSTGTITRNDSSNYDGTNVNKNPLTNIALTGVVTVTCEDDADKIDATMVQYRAGTSTISAPPNIISPSVSKGRGAGHRAWFPCFFPSAFSIKAMGLWVSTADAGSVETLAGIYSSNKNTGEAHELLFSTGHLDCSAAVAVLETLAKPLIQPAGIYWLVSQSDSATARFYGANKGGFATPFGALVSSIIGTPRETGKSGPLPAIAPALTVTENNGTVVPILQYGL